MPIFKPLVIPMKSRRTDKYGSGQPGARRKRSGNIQGIHKGIDIVAMPNQRVFSPMNGQIIREAFPYKDDHSLRGILLRGEGEFAGYEIKLFYVNGLFSGEAKSGQLIGFAADLSKKYPGITNHVHFEVKLMGDDVDPRSCFPYCF